MTVLFEEGTDDEDMAHQITSPTTLNHSCNGSSHVLIQIGSLSIDVKHDKQWEDKTIFTSEVMPRQTIFKRAMFNEKRNKTLDYVVLMEEENQANTLSRMKRNKYPIHVQHKVMMMRKTCHSDQSL